MHYKTKVLIIGSGPAGYTAAIYAARANLEPILVSGLEPGGQLMITTDVENYPGFADVIQGPWLMEQMKLQAEHVGTQLISDYISEVDFSKRPFVCRGDFGNTFVADTLIIATGAQAKWLGLESETKFRGFGVSACATCDGFFFKGKNVAVIGGGNTAVEEALYMTNHAAHVTLVHRRDTLRAEKILQDRLLAHPKVSVIWDSVVEEVLGTENPTSLSALRLKNTKTGEITEKAFDGVFVAIGHVPNTHVFKGKLDLDHEGYIVGPTHTTETSVSGVFAAGDVRDKVYRQAVTAAGLGCMAALDVQRYLQEH
ncbi:Thioredoxin-disulfide reductase [Candidatus Bealeia paramacronuclearis]|uniref:Thioredoxin reductase n=1 Tax=Candidatus Bealeia paramacronuclearis TaxID=1921001 RepID=A0ABZ2C5J9_9PROT|nr:Thioredoxin-disulfide reductase [Candidatus Bealeia paramacronuclearis]